MEQDEGRGEGRWWWRDMVLACLLTGCALGFWGAHQYQRGLRAGVDMSLCAMRVGLATGVIPHSLSECRERDTAVHKTSSPLPPADPPLI